MPNNYQYHPEFKPLLLAGQSARLLRSPTSWVDVSVIAVGPLAVHRHDFGALGAALLSQDDTHLDMPTGQMAQYRYIPRGPFGVHLQHPGGVDQYITSGSVKANLLESFRILPMGDDPNELNEVRRSLWMLSEFLVFEDETPRFDCYPMGRPSARDRAQIDFYGIRYSLAKFKPRVANETPMVNVWISGWPPGEVLV